MKHLPSIDFDAPSAGGDKAPTPEDTLRLLDAYNRIQDPAQRAELFSLLIRLASVSPEYQRILRRRAIRH
jgi:hypothetical protein